MKKLIYRGFTLVELSIVLVVIGLLVGGLLLAQSIIGVSKVQAFASQISEADVAMANFKNTYGALPGDSSIKYVNVAGNEDGLISSSTATSIYYSCGATDSRPCELSNVWPTLSTSGFKAPENPKTGYITTLSYNGQYPYSAPNAPRAKIGYKSGLFVVGDISPAVFSTSGYTGVVNMYFVANCSAVTAPSWGGCRNSMSGSEAIAVDAKMDDGIGTTGFVVGARLSSLVTAGAFLSSWVTTAAETAYVPGNTVNTTTGNILVIRLGRKTGEVRK